MSNIKTPALFLLTPQELLFVTHRLLCAIYFLQNFSQKPRKSEGGKEKLGRCIRGNDEHILVEKKTLSLQRSCNNLSRS